MSDRLDGAIRSLVVEVIESSPPPPSARTVMRLVSPRWALPSWVPGWLVMTTAAAAVLLVGLAGVWIGRSTAPPTEVVDRLPVPGLGEITDPVVSGERLGAHFAVGRTEEGMFCVEAGSPTHARSSCTSEIRRESVEAVVVQAGRNLVVAGYAQQAAQLAIVLDGEERRLLDLTSVPGRNDLAFGTIIEAQPEIVEIQVIDDQGQIVKRHFPSIGP